MSLKPQFFRSHLDFFQDNLKDFIEEHGERIHRDVKPMGRRYQGQLDSAMMEDCIWCFMRRDTLAHEQRYRSAIHF